jgi:hypothetical protein
MHFYRLAFSKSRCLWPAVSKRSIFWPVWPPGGGLIFNRAPALLRHPVCVFRVPRPKPKPRLPEKVGTPLRKAARVVRGGARPPHPWRTECEGLDEVTRRALLAFVSAPQVLLDSGVGGAGVADERRAADARE